MSLRILLTLVLAAFPCARLCAAEARPNFLFIYTDDQRWDALGVVQREQGQRGRFPWLKTPNLDRLAAEGVRFRNAFVVTSLCAPSRAAFLTGRYGHVNGVVNNHTDFPVANATHASLLRSAGYTTGYIGKWHMGKQSGQRPGFDYSASFVGQGKYFDCPFEINGKSTETKGWVDDASTEFALEFLRKNREKAFSLVLGFKTCHGPFQPPPRNAELFPGALARSTPNLRAPGVYLAEDRQRQIRATEFPTAGPTNLGYFRGVAAVDENVGRILKLLDELQLSQNTMVVFASDNGYYLGEHGLGDKRTSYEESLRIPLLLRFPKLGVKDKRIDQLALNIDLAPTIVDFAGLPVPKQMQGRSWRPLLEGRPADWRKAFFHAYVMERGFGAPTNLALRTERAKLIRYPGHPEWTELFDLAADPQEMRNLYADPAQAALRKELEAEFERQTKLVGFNMATASDGSPVPAGPAALNAWVLEYRFDRDQGDKVIDASGKGNHGKASGAPVVDGRDGRKARRFDGRATIESPKSESLRPNVPGWTIEASFKADKPDGVVLARGGRTAGYCLYLDAGLPVLAVTVDNRLVQVRGKQAVAGAWVDVSARITADRRVVLSNNGKEAARGKLRDWIDRDPHDGMQIGADHHSPVVEGKKLPGFTGLIESVRLYSGEAP